MLVKKSTKHRVIFGVLMVSTASVGRADEVSREPVVDLVSERALESEMEREMERVNVLEESVVSDQWLGSPTSVSVKTYTGSRSVIEKETLHESGALNLEDAIRRTPGIHVLDETGTGILPNIGVRGLNPLRSERVQFLVDGYPIALGPYSNIGVSLFPVTLPSLEVIDVVRGGAAVHYGPNNVGGVLNAVTRPMGDEISQTLKEHLTIAEETGNLLTDSYYRTGGYLTDQLGLQLQVNFQSGDGFRDHSDTDVQNIILESRYWVNEVHDLATQLQYYTADAELPGALSPAAYTQNRTQSQRPFDGFEADMLRGTLTWTFMPTDNVHFQWRNFAHNANRTFFFGQRLGTGDKVADPALPSTHVADSPRQFKVFGTEPRITLHQGNHSFTLGARYVSEAVEFDVNRLEFATRTYSVARDWALDTDAYAVYMSDTLHYWDDRITVTPGVRYERVIMDFDDLVNDAHSENRADKALPGLTVGFHANDRLFIFSNIQRSLVPVQIAQATRAGDVANETAWNYELGSRFTVSNSVNFATTLFRIDYDDQIQFNRDLTIFENLGRTRHQGIELETRWTPNNWALGMGYVFLDTEQRNGANAGKALPNAPRHHITTEATYTYDQWRASLTGLYASDSFSDAANTEQEMADGSAGQLPSYVLLNARIGWTVPIDQGKTLGLAVAINNVLDDDSYFRGVDVSPIGRLPTPGRSYLLEAQLDF